MRRAHVVRRRRLGAAAVARDGAAVGEHAARQVRAGQRQEARDRVEPPVVLALPALRDAADQPDGVGMPRLAQDLLRRALLDQRAGVQHAHAVAHAGDHAEVVGDEEHRGAELRRRAATRSSTSACTVASSAVVGSSSTSRVGSVRERHRDHDALLHAARELVGVAVHDPGRVGDLHLAQHRLGALARLAAFAPRSSKTSATCRPTRIDGFSARPDPGRPSRPSEPQPAQLVLAQRQHVAAADADAAAAHAAVGGQVADDRHGHRRLAAAGLADEPVRPAARDREARRRAAPRARCRARGRRRRGRATSSAARRAAASVDQARPAHRSPYLLQAVGDRG